LWEQAPGRRLSQKHVDFVLYEQDTTRIVAAIELDDASHEQPDRRARDQFLDAAMKAAKTPLIRVRAACRYNAVALRQIIQNALSQNSEVVANAGPPQRSGPKSGRVKRRRTSYPRGPWTRRKNHDRMPQ
jgi:hypothetical protein